MTTSIPVEAPTVLVGYDASAAARVAVEQALALAGPSGTLIVAHVIQVPEEYVGTPYAPELFERETARGDAALDALERELPELAALGYERQIVQGPPARALVQLADHRQADVIVLGSRGHGRLRSLLGSVAVDVIHRAGCPVHVIPQRMAERVAEPAGAAGMLV
jgi:nucleotide-binding universal stress UspA family protein